MSVIGDDELLLRASQYTQSSFKCSQTKMQPTYVSAWNEVPFC